MVLHLYLPRENKKPFEKYTKLIKCNVTIFVGAAKTAPSSYCHGDHLAEFHGLLGAGGGQRLLGSHVLHEGPACFISRGSSLCHGLQTDCTTMTKPVPAVVCSTQRPSSSSAGSGLAAAAGRQIKDPERSTDNMNNGMVNFDLVMALNRCG